MPRQARLGRLASPEWVTREVLGAWGILLVPVVVIALAYSPGQMNIDMLAQIHDVVTGDITNWHAPLLDAAWSVLWDLGVGPGWVLAAQLITFVAGASLVLRSVLSWIPAALAVAAISLSPPVFSVLGSMQRDVWFTALRYSLSGSRCERRSSGGRRAGGC